MTTYRAGVIGHTGRGNYGHSLDTVYLGMEEIELVRRGRRRRRRSG